MDFERTTDYWVFDWLLERRGLLLRERAPDTYSVGGVIRQSFPRLLPSKNSMIYDGVLQGGGELLCIFFPLTNSPQSSSDSAPAGGCYNER